jgi:hypothetical protein
MTKKRTSAKRARDAAAEPQATAAIEPTIPFRGRVPVEPPREPLVDVMRPAIGPNPDGFTHLAILAHATDDEERALLAAQLEARHTTEG